MKKIIYWFAPALSMGFFSCLFDDAASTTSTATTENKTENIDARVVGGTGSSNISANNSTVSMTTITTDNGAVKLATELSSANTKKVLDTGKSMFDGALAAVSKANTESMSNQQQMFNGALADVTSAYSNAVTPENTQMKIAGFVVVGIAALSLFALKK